MVEDTPAGGVRIRNTHTGQAKYSRWMRPGWKGARKYAEQAARELNRRAATTANKGDRA